MKINYQIKRGNLILTKNYLINILKCKSEIRGNDETFKTNSSGRNFGLREKKILAYSKWTNYIDIETSSWEEIKEFIDKNYNS